LLAALRSFRARDHRPTSQEVAAETGLSYPTVRRYLEFLSSRKQVEQAVVYQDGRPGRPLYTYRLLDEG
jgi:response regulator of citrate/malate metabolism